MPICGGISDSDSAATPEIQALIEAVKDEVHGKLNTVFEVFEAVSYRSQVVAGRNYFIKVLSQPQLSIVLTKLASLSLQVRVGDDKHIHLRVFKSLSQEVSLHSVQADKTEADPIEYF